LARKVWVTLRSVNIKGLPEELEIVRACEARLGWQSTPQVAIPEDAKTPLSRRSLSDPAAMAAELCRKACSALPAIPPDKAQAYVEILERAWGSLDTVDGSVSQVEEFARGILGRLARQPGFVVFMLDVSDDDECAQVSAILQGGFTGVRVWRNGRERLLCAAPTGV